MVSGASPSKRGLIVAVVVVLVCGAVLLAAQASSQKSVVSLTGKDGKCCLLDPKSVKLVSPMDMESAKLIHVQPGKVSGSVKALDGAVYKQTKLALCDAKSGKSLKTTSTDASGQYAFVDVAQGRYVLHLPQFNVGAVVSVESSAQAMPLNVVVREAQMAVAAPALVPEVVAAHPVIAGVAGGVIVVGGVWGAVELSDDGTNDHDHGVISPSEPM
jgi:hypothetical protein